MLYQSRLLRILLLIVLFFGCSQISAQKAVLKKGEIIDSVFVDKSINESYAIYVPTTYKQAIPSSIVFIFDPMARGRIGVHPFIKAAEKYGIILVCSNTSKNGPYEQNFEITNRLFDHVFTNYNINKQSIYTAGFSGGARLASAIAVLTKQIQGVIACGASYSNAHVPSSNDFSYASIIGDTDMNLVEMRNAKNFFDTINIPNELFIYEIGHEWPTQDQIVSAFDWLQLEGYRKNLIPENLDNIKNSYVQNYQRAQALERALKLVYAFYEYERILRNYKDFFTLDSISSKLKKIKNSTAYIKENKRFLSLLKKEETRADVFIKRFNNDLFLGQFNKAWWKSETRKIDKEKKNADPAKKKMLERVSFKIFAMAFESAQRFSNDQNLDKAIFCYEICIYIYPTYHVPYLEQAANYIRKNDQKKAVAYIEKLLETGYKNSMAIKQDKRLEKLKNNKRFKELLNP